MEKLLTIAFLSLAVAACGSSDSTSSDDASDSAYVGGTATPAERKAYSRDIYSKPEGMTGEQKDRYEKMAPEGQEYVDEKMKQYDDLCSRSSEC